MSRNPPSVDPGEIKVAAQSEKHGQPAMMFTAKARFIAEKGFHLLLTALRDVSWPRGRDFRPSP